MGTRKHHQPLSLSSSLIQGYLAPAGQHFLLSLAEPFLSQRPCGGDRHGSSGPKPSKNGAGEVPPLPCCTPEPGGSLLAAPNPGEQQLLSPWGCGQGPAPALVPVPPSTLQQGCPGIPHSRNSKPCLACPACAHLQKVHLS